MESLKIFLLLAIIQGLTEFLPVSSSGHLALAQLMLKSFKEAPVVFDLFLHLGTLLATILFFKKEIKDILESIAKNLKMPKNLLFFNKDSDNKIPAILYTTLITALIAFPLKNYAEKAFLKSNYVLLGFFITSLLLLSTKFVKNNSSKSFTLKDSIAIGLIQGIAIFPGISRSGSTISVAIFLGIENNLAFAFSFLISIPAIAGATIIESLPHLENLSKNISNYLLSSFIAFITGYISLLLLSKIMSKKRFYFFSYYCLLIIIVAIIYWVYNQIFL